MLDRASALGAGTSPDVTAAADPLAGVLRSVRLTGALFFLVDASSPWCVDIPKARDYAGIILPGAPHILSFHIVVDGTGWARVPGQDPVPMAPGDIILFPHGDPYVMESEPGAPPEFDAAQTLDFFRALAAGALPFTVTEGGGGDPPARVICGFLGCNGRPFNPVLESLPRLLRLQRPDAGSGGLLDRLIEMTLEEAQANRAGGRSVSLRLSELMFMELLRRYAAAPGPKQAGWLAGLGDAPIARTLAALHDRPAERWTVERLSQEAGLSRSRLAERFARLVGHAPMRYLTLWRMHLAATALDETAAPIAQVAADIGYGSEAAFSRGFKKVTGVSPDAWRRGVRA